MSWPMKLPKSIPATARLGARELPPVTSWMTGVMMSFTSELTMPVNAPPTMMPTAMSITLPRAMNSLNSSTILIAFPRPPRGLTSPARRCREGR